MAQEIVIEKWDPTRNGPLNQINMENKLHQLGYKFIKYTFSPGTEFPDHTHTVSKKDAILTGRFQFSMYGKTVVLEPGDIVDIPQNTIHNARVVGNQKVDFFDATK